jgi:SAM-dependent methyltransferase
MKKRRNAQAWNREYARGEFLKLSAEPGEDLIKAVRHVERESKREFLNPLALAFDVGCGNGRHIKYLSESYGMRGYAIDISREAILQAQEVSEGLPITYEVRDIAGTYEHLKDNSVSLVIDMMSSHVLRDTERTVYRDELLRVTKPNGWIIIKSFLADEDINVRKLLRDHAADEKDAYIHPDFGVYEHVWTEESFIDFFSSVFSIDKIEKSHRHIIKGRAGKRRTITVCMRKV